MRTTIKKGKALVLAGPQGCGKSTVARNIAKLNGPFVEIEAIDLESKFQDWMESQPRTVIVDGLPLHSGMLQRLKAWITADYIRVHRKRQQPVDLAAPAFIFCTADVDAVNGLDHRQFEVVELAR